MSLAYLEELERTNLPIRVTDPESIGKALLLHGALLIEAAFFRHAYHSSPHAAVIYRITSTGSAILEKRKKARALLPRTEQNHEIPPLYSASMAKKRVLVEGREQMIAALKHLEARVADGECVAIRVMSHDGTFEDVVLGGTEEEQRDALENLRKADLH